MIHGNELVAAFEVGCAFFVAPQAPPFPSAPQEGGAVPTWHDRQAHVFTSLPCRAPIKIRVCKSPSRGPRLVAEPVGHGPEVLPQLRGLPGNSTLPPLPCTKVKAWRTHVDRLTAGSTVGNSDSDSPPPRARHGYRDERPGT